MGSSAKSVAEMRSGGKDGVGLRKSQSRRATMERDKKSLWGIQGWIVYQVREEPERIVVKVGKPRKGARCPNCGAMSLRVHQRMGWRQVWHMAVAGRGLYLEFRPRRFWCSECRRAFTETYEEIGKWRRQSRLGEGLLLRELRRQSLSPVRRKARMDYKTLRQLVERAEMGAE